MPVILLSLLKKYISFGWCKNWFISCDIKNFPFRYLNNRGNFKWNYIPQMDFLCYLCVKFSMDEGEDLIRFSIFGPSAVTRFHFYFMQRKRFQCFHYYDYDVLCVDENVPLCISTQSMKSIELNCGWAIYLSIVHNIKRNVGGFG